MAVYRGRIAFWVRCGRSHGCRQPIKQHSWSLTETLDSQLSGPSRPISCISWALTSPNYQRHQAVGQSSFESSLSHHARLTGHPIRTLSLEEWEETVGLCVLLGPGECEGQRTLVEVHLLGQARLGELPVSGSTRPGEFLFPLTTVDGTREDDISIRGGERGGERGRNEEMGKRERESFRSLFQMEHCPAPFMWGSRYYCFHCPARKPLTGCRDKSSLRTGLDVQAAVLSPWPFLSYCGHTGMEGGEGREKEREREREEKLAVMYERLRMELPLFFVKNHDYTMYSNDIEFINGLLHTKTRGRVLYQLTLSLWKLLCACYFADVRLEVLKLTKHSEDGTVQARWRLKGLPFHLLLLRFYRKDKTHLYRSYDAFSTFYLGPDGLIHCHRVDKVMRATPPVVPRVTSVLAGALVALGLQEHRPALNLLPLLLSSLRTGRQ
ncbi:hypothetical protein MATL_G00228140 [Megalops atlanticus]|uniref:Uncharacterized protein n=1 Tax=Megalops atlanticus TaxID=7932 RepID=A0A9D3PCY2_MEGAT|nr:hypothetical protein MATL_G00228140 [Megalops atlanticus]